MRFSSGRVLILTGLVAATICLGVSAQETRQTTREETDGQRRESRESVPTARPVDPSDLGQENLQRVAASSAQIQAVLVKDPGILVELKRWVAKEATDNGQVVDDAALTDQVDL